jgi:calcineurin-like phosphoesterase family protein
LKTEDQKWSVGSNPTLPSKNRKITMNLPWDIPKEIPRQSGKKKLWLTSDEHYKHRKIIRYQNRPFSSIEEMDECLKRNHNSLVKPEDCVIHIGDFSFGKANDFKEIALSLNGKHFFMDGSHDRSLREFFASNELKEGTQNSLFLLPKLFEFTFNGQKIVLCHYSLQKWWASHYGSYHFYGHSHGNNENVIKNSRDIGVDTNNFFPILIEDAIKSVSDDK